MPTCPTCFSPLDDSADGSEAVCRICVMNELMGDPDTYAGSSDADDYEIIREIGRGGDGTVYLAQDLKVDRQVAIKLLNTLRLGDKATQRRFYAESDAIASLDHPNIIPILASGEMDSRPFFTMKYIDNGNLSDRFDDFSSAVDIADLISKIARGIHHAHRRGLLHRDLKPSNILIDQQKEPYITDFGLAKRESENLNLTLTGAIMGTPAYMSPEQARGDTSQITTSTDIFSIGTMFYQLLSGRTPFGGENPHIVLKNVIESEVTFHDHETKHFDRDLETICLKCLRKQPENRYPTALALAEDLERWSRGEPVTARRISSGERVLRFVKKHPISIAAVTFGILSLIAGLITSTILWQRADELAQSESAGRAIAEENHYYATLSNALTAREKFDLGRSKLLLDSAPGKFRGFEWNLLKSLAHGDQDSSVPLPSSKPIHLCYDSFHQRILLLTEDRKIHHYDPEQNTITFLTSLPENPLPKTKSIFPGLRRLSIAPDGKHYLFVENAHFHIVENSSSKIIQSGKAPKKGDARWLDAKTVLSATGPIYSAIDPKTKKPGESAWLTTLHEGSTPLPKKGFAGPITISPDGSYIALTQENSSIAIYRRAQDFSEEPHHLITLRYWIRSSAFSPDGRYFHCTSGPEDTTFHVFDFETKEQLFAKDWQSDTVVHPNPLHPGRFIIIGRDPWFTSWDPFLKIKNPASNQEPVPPPKSLMARRFKTGTPDFFFGHHTPVLASLIPPGKNYLLTASGDQTLRKWSLAPGKTNVLPTEKLLTAHGRAHPTASHNGKYVLSSYAIAGPPVPAQSNLWHPSSNRFFPLPEGHNYLAVLNDARVFTLHNKTGELFAWQFSLDQPLKELWRTSFPPLHDGLDQVIHCSVSPDERIISLLHVSHVLTINTETRAISIDDTQSFTPGSTPGQTIATSPDGKLTAVTGFSGIYPALYQAEGLKSGPQRLIPATAYQSKDSTCAFSHDGKKIFVGNDEGIVRVFDSSTLKELPEEAWKAHNTEITALAVSQKGDIVVTAGGSDTIFWSTRKEEGKERRRRLLIETGLPARNWVQFCGNDTLLLHSAPRSPLEIWEAGW